jgi:hypothetical protein
MCGYLLHLYKNSANTIVIGTPVEEDGITNTLQAVVLSFLYIPICVYQNMQEFRFTTEMSI